MHLFFIMRTAAASKTMINMSKYFTLVYIFTLLGKFQNHHPSNNVHYFMQSSVKTSMICPD